VKVLIAGWYSFEQMGTNKVFVTPQNFADPAGAEGLTTEDVESIEDFPEIDYIVPAISGNVKAEFKDEVKLLMYFAFPADLAEKFFDDFGLTR